MDVSLVHSEFSMKSRDNSTSSSPSSSSSPLLLLPFLLLLRSDPHTTSPSGETMQQLWKTFNTFTEIF